MKIATTLSPAPAVGVTQHYALTHLGGKSEFTEADARRHRVDAATPPSNRGPLALVVSSRHDLPPECRQFYEGRDHVVDGVVIGRQCHLVWLYASDAVSVNAYGKEVGAGDIQVLDPDQALTQYESLRLERSRLY